MRSARRHLVILLVGGILACASQVAMAVKLGDATITLQSQRYYKKWDLTRFVYRVKSPKNNIPEAWYLGTNSCLSADQVDLWSSTPFEWVDEPIEGLRYGVISRNARYYLWLFGQWDVGDVEVAVDFGGNGSGLLTGSIDGPYCEGSSISLVVALGATVGFPQILQSGDYAADSSSQLLVSSTSSGWSLDYTLEVSAPAEAQEAVVARIFSLAIAPHGTRAGATEVDVSYALTVTDDDFGGLPEGDYVIGITYTVTSDD